MSNENINIEQEKCPAEMQNTNETEGHPDIEIIEEIKIEELSIDGICGVY